MEPGSQHQHLKKRNHVGQSVWLARLVLLLLLLASVVGVFVLLLPYLHSFILAALLAAVFYPMHSWLRGKMEPRCQRLHLPIKCSNIAALFSVLLVSLLVVIPLALFIIAMVNQGIDVFQQIRTWLAQDKLQELLASSSVQNLLHHPWVERLQGLIANHIDTLNLADFDLGDKLLALSEKAYSFTANRIVPLLTATWSVVFGFFIMLFLMFYLFRDGRKLLAFILHMSPLPASQEHTLIKRIKDVTRAVLLGMFLTAAAQGVAGAVGFLVVGIPALFWGTMLGLASIIPVVGTALVWVPAAIYLFLIGRVKSGIFLILWSVLVVGVIDNVLRPILMQGGAKMSPAVIFFAILGGINTFGLVGLLYGPLIFGLCAVCFYIYEMELNAFLSRQDRR